MLAVGWPVSHCCRNKVGQARRINTGSWTCLNCGEITKALVILWSTWLEVFMLLVILDDVRVTLTLYNNLLFELLGYVLTINIFKNEQSLENFLILPSLLGFGHILNRCEFSKERLSSRMLSTSLDKPVLRASPVKTLWSNHSGCGCWSSRRCWQGKYTLRPVWILRSSVTVKFGSTPSRCDYIHLMYKITRIKRIYFYRYQSVIK